MYATVADLRAEGVTEAMAPDVRLLALIDEAGRAIDRVTGWFFEPRAATLVLDGRGAPSLEPPVPPIRLDRLEIGRMAVALPDEVVVVGAPVGPGFDAPRITLRSERLFPRATGNVEAEGRTPLEIRRACMLFVLRLLHPLAGAASTDARNRWRIIEERTRDQSYRLDGVKEVGPFTGDPELDSILARYRRPLGMGAA
jgi:hypothetical protein